MTIYKKLIRDLYEHKGANFATMIVIAIGIMAFNGSAKTVDDITASKDAFYKECVFPDVYAKTIATPIDFASSFRKVDGIKQLEARMSEDVKVFGTNKTLRLISSTKNIGKYEIIEGRDVNGYDYEIVLGNTFGKANGYKLGDTIEIVCLGKTAKLKVCGFARSSENIFAIKDETTVFSDPKQFGVSFIDLKIMMAITGRNSFDEILFLLQKDVELSDVKNEIQKQIDNFGVISIYGKKDQLSNVTVNGEIEELKTIMILVPLVFFIVATLVMSIMIKRIISKQRGQIGVLKAFGYTDFEVGMHYASYCIVLGVLGGIVGYGLGVWLADVFTDMYKTFFNMEFINAFDNSRYFLRGIILSTVFCVIVGVRASKKAMQIQPAEAMRQETPVSGHKSFVEKYRFFNWIFDIKGKMAIRNIVRNRRRSLFIVGGLSIAFAASVMPWSMLYMMDNIVYDTYKYVEKYDAKITTTHLIKSEDGIRELDKFDGVTKIETMLDVPSKLEKGGVVVEIPTVGLSEKKELFDLVDKNNKSVPLPRSGIVLSQRVAQKLGVKLGDNVTFKSPYFKYKEDEKIVEVTSIVAQGVGMNGYMEIGFLSRLLGYDDMCNKVIINVSDEDVIQRIADKYEDAYGVKSVQSKKDIIEQVNGRMETAYSSIYFMAIIGIIMTFSTVYNIFLVVILEREREFATLMVLGMREREVMSIVALEQWLSVFVGMIVGLPISKALVIIISRELSSDMFTIPSKLDIKSLILALLCMVISVLLAQLFASGKMKQINIVNSLKSAE